MFFHGKNVDATTGLYQQAAQLRVNIVAGISEVLAEHQDPHNGGISREPSSEQKVLNTWGLFVGAQHLRQTDSPEMM